MTGIDTVLTESLDIWTSAIDRKNGAGRGRSKKVSFYGIEKLRALILDLAVRGKLVPQDPNDVPASELLKHIHSERDEWVAKKRMRKGKRLPTVQGDEERFPSPEGWLWIRLNDVGDWGAGSTPNRKHMEYYDGEMPWFKSGELSSDFISESEETITELALEQCSLRINRPGDVLIAMYGATIGKASILEVEATTNQAICACTPFLGVNNRYLLLTLKAMRPIFIGQGAGGAQPNISREKIVATPIALPPFAEQSRIVAKVDELMVLCDTLEAETSDAVEAHQVLVEQLLATLTNSQDAKELARNWVRIEEHFDLLFTTEDSVDQLKQTILQLAVMGKLVPQDPKDEPSVNFDPKLPAELKRPFEIPNSWNWARMYTLGELKGGGTPSKSREEFWNGDIPWVSPKDMKVDYISNAQLHITDTALAESAANLITPGSILFVVRGMILAHSFPTAINKKPVVINQDMKALALNEPEMGEFVLLALRGLKTRVLEVVQRSGHGTCRLDGRTYRDFLVPIPPLAEQHAILQKVSSLLALCDALQEQLREANKQRILFADSAVSNAVGVDHAPDFAKQPA